MSSTHLMTNHFNRVIGFRKLILVVWLVAAHFCAEALVFAADLPFSLDPGFESLFDGKTLEGWEAPPNSYAVDEGVLICVAGGKGNLLTKKEYADFIFKFEFKLTAGANNGLGIRCPHRLEGNLHLDGIELQILDDNDEKYKTIKPYQHHGSIYGIVPAKIGFLKPLGEWNQEEVSVQGSRIKVTLNGTVIVEANLDEATKAGTVDGQQHPGLKRARGHLGFLGHGDRVDFRKLQIKDLSKP